MPNPDNLKCSAQGVTSAGPAAPRRRHPVVLLAGISCAIAIVACVFIFVRSRHLFDMVQLDLNDPLPEFDVYLTWRGYDGRSWARDAGHDAVFIWNGIEVGRGERGADEVIRRLAQMPTGSRILIYPRYEMEWEMHGSRLYPFLLLRGDEFFDVAMRRRVTLICSPRDHEGQICPECVDPRTSSRPSHN